MSVESRVAALFNRTKNAPKLSTSVVTHDMLDEGVLEELREHAQTFESAFSAVPTVNVGTDDNPDERPFDLALDLFADTFYAMHTYDEPEIKPGEEVRPDHELFRQIEQQFIHSDGFQELRPYTRHDDVGSGIAFMRFRESIQESLQTTLKEHAERAARMKEQIEQMQANEERLEDLRQQVREQGGHASQEQKDAIKAAAQAKSNARKGLQQNVEEQQTAPLGMAAAEAVEQAAQDAKEDAEAVSNLPGQGAGTGQRLTPEQALDVAMKWKNDPKLKEIAKLAGRMERDMRYKRTQRVVGGREEPIDVKLGDDLSLALPTELMKLRHPLLRLDFMRRYHEKQIVQYETQGTAEAGKGPVIFAVDGSGSMGGQRNVWARAVALGIVSIAHREKRHAAVVEFGYDESELQEWHFPAKKPIDITTVTDCASHFNGGGTDITTGVQRCVEIMNKHPQFKKADIILVTDGHDHLGDDDIALRDALRERGVRILGVTIGIAPTPYITEMCEEVTGVYDLTSPSDATDMIASGIQ